MSLAYGAVVPMPIRQGVNNFSSNLGMPNTIINNTLQGDLDSAATNTGRFLVNSTFGLLGFFDPSASMGVPENETDFGETLYVWGVNEGPFLELPFLGPSNRRDAVGKIVDVALNPLNYIFDRSVLNYTRGAAVASGADSRYRFTDTIDSVLYESADSYAQSRLIYLQNRRFELGQSAPQTSSTTSEDLLDDLYFE